MSIKKPMITIAVMILLLVSIISAQKIPLPVNGRVEGESVENLDIRVTNTASGYSTTGKTNYAGEYLIEWANTPDVPRGGDVFEVEILNCVSYSSKCKKSITYSGQYELFLVFDISGVLKCPVLECKSRSCDCDEPEPCSSTPSIPCSSDCPDDTTPFAQCDSCCPSVADKECPPENVCEVCQECPLLEDSNLGAEIIIGLIIGFIGFLGGGLKFYVGRDGSVKSLHRHRGIKSYHDMNISHKNKIYRHRLLKDDPAGFVEDIAKIEKDGGLTL